MTYGYLRDVQSLLFGDARARFREAAVELGFEPYHGYGGYGLGTPGVRDGADEGGSERIGAER